MAPWCTTRPVARRAWYAQQLAIIRWRLAALYRSGHQEARILRGSCLCGDIKYQIDGRLSGAVNCHCSMCRKAQGSAFRSRAAVKSAEFTFIQGEELITFYESSAGNHRGFCRVCGSPILSKFDDHPNYYGLPLGALDDDPGIRPKLHVHVASKAPWHTITDDLPQLPGAPQQSGGA
jgi:hypothetical protein